MINFISRVTQAMSFLVFCIIGVWIILVFWYFETQKVAKEESFVCEASAINQSQYLVALSDTAKIGQKLFEENCTPCHSMGERRVVGPGLKNILERRSEDWLTPWIQNSQKVIASGDPYAIKLYKKYDKVIMPNFDSLKLDEIKAIIEYLREGEQVIYFD